MTRTVIVLRNRVKLELRRLLDTTRKAPTRFGLTGLERARLYEVTVTTGLRASELPSLTWGSFDLDANPPTVTVKAAYSKHRRDDTLPLKASTAAMLALWRDESDRADPARFSPECPQKAIPPRC